MLRDCTLYRACCIPKPHRYLPTESELADDHYKAPAIYAHALLCQALRVALPSALEQRGGIWVVG